MEKPSLSVIIPCYNCAETLKEAVDSCYMQGLGDTFEIVMVDDGSTDGTRVLMETLAAAYTNIRLFFHEKNKGGGAARNTAVEHAAAEIIFCLDSDDMLGEGTLKKMLDLMHRTIAAGKKCDGIGIHFSKKFRGKNKDDIERIDTFSFSNTSHTNAAGHTPIPFESLFQKEGVMCPLYSTFMHTREAFRIAGGYPTEHGFDTQAFAWRFLANGLIAYTCADTVYLHRLHFNTSYYAREYESGKINRNWFLIFQEFFYFFSPQAQQILLETDLGSERSLSDLIFKESDDVLATDYRKHILHHTRRSYHDELIAKKGQKSATDSLTLSDNYWLGWYYHSEKKWPEAETYLSRAIAQIAQVTSVHSTEAAYISEKISFLLYDSRGEQGDDKAAALARDLLINMTRNKYGSKRPLLTRIAKKIIKIAARARFQTVYRYIQGNIACRLRARHSIALMYNWKKLVLRKICRQSFTETCVSASHEPIDLVIPTLSKDRALVLLVIESVRAQVCQPIQNIYIVSNKSDEIVHLCQEHHFTFIDERSVLGYGKEKTPYRVNGIDRSGWLFQQLLKLSGDTFVKARHYLIVDSDTVLIKKHSFLTSDAPHQKTIFRQNEEWHEPYFRNFERIFGYEAPTRLSYTSHMMLFDTIYLKAMKKEIAEKHHAPWDEVYRASAEDGEKNQEPSCISDYDTYANWVLYNHPEAVTSIPFYNKSLSRKALAPLASLEEAYARRYASLSFHSYTRITPIK